jgi:hypothetical protein
MGNSFFAGETKHPWDYKEDTTKNIDVIVVLVSTPKKNKHDKIESGHYVKLSLK